MRMAILLFIWLLQCLAVLRCYELWSVEDWTPRKCYVKGLILRNMVGRERDVGGLNESGYKQQRNQPAQTFLVEPNTLTSNEQQYFVGDTACQSTKWQECKKFGRGVTPLVLPGYDFGYKKIIKTKQQYLLDVQSSTHKKLATMQDGQTLQNSDKKQNCQWWMLR